jgi:hypothetical protein
MKAFLEDFPGFKLLNPWQTGLSHGLFRFSVVIFYRVTDNVFGNGEQLGTRRFRVS